MDCSYWSYCANKIYWDKDYRELKETLTFEDYLDDYNQIELIFDTLNDRVGLNHNNLENAVYCFKSILSNKDILSTLNTRELFEAELVDRFENLFK